MRRVSRSASYTSRTVTSPSRHTTFMMASSWVVRVEAGLRILSTNYLVLTNQQSRRKVGVCRGGSADRFQQEIVKIETEIGGGRNRAHFRRIDRAVRVEGE